MLGVTSLSSISGSRVEWGEDERLVSPSSMVPNLVQVAQEGLNLFSQSCSQSVHLTSSKKETKQPSSKLSGLHANWLEKGRPFLLITHLGQRLCVLHNDLEQTYLPEVLGVEGHRGG